MRIIIMSFKKGDKLMCIRYDRPGIYLTWNKIYTAIKDEEPGIFATDPYITVKGDFGKNLTCHASRFKKIEEE
jgi:hypothetical protein